MTRVRTCLRLYPTMIEYCQARLARETEAQSIAKKMQKLCTPFGNECGRRSQPAKPVIYCLIYSHCGCHCQGIKREHSRDECRNLATRAMGCSLDVGTQAIVK